MICAIALALLLDGSASMGPDWATQRRVTAEAIESQAVIDAVERQGAIAISVLQFSYQTTVEIDWQLVRNAEDLRNVAARVREIRFQSGGNTLIGAALSTALDHLERQNLCDPDQEIIDLSTDGVDNDRVATTTARDRASERGTRINVIAVGTENWANDLREHVVTPDGFVLHSSTWEDYDRLFRRKIIVEMTGAQP